MNDVTSRLGLMIDRAVRFAQVLVIGNESSGADASFETN